MAVTVSLDLSGSSIDQGAVVLKGRRLDGKVNEMACLGPGLGTPVTALVTEVVWGRWGWEER